MMALALFVAYRALKSCETPVACILVRDGKVLSTGFNGTNDTLNGTKHAEFIAIDKVFDSYLDRGKGTETIQAYFKDVILYVTVEPCIMCASALKQLGIGKVIYGCGNDRFGGNGTVLSIHNDSIYSDLNYMSYGGILRTEAIQLLRNFYIQENESAPIPKIKKNKELSDKEYPSNIDFEKLYTKEEICGFYGAVNSEYLKTLREVCLEGGYKLKDLIKYKDVMRIPDLDIMYEVDVTEELIEEDLDEFYDYFYDIIDGRVDFTKEIITVDSVKRRRTH